MVSKVRPLAVLGYVPEYETSIARLGTRVPHSIYPTKLTLGRFVRERAGIVECFAV